MVATSVSDFMKTSLRFGFALYACKVYYARSVKWLTIPVCHSKEGVHMTLFEMFSHHQSHSPFLERMHMNHANPILAYQTTRSMIL